MKVKNQSSYFLGKCTSNFKRIYWKLEHSSSLDIGLFLWVLLSFFFYFFIFWTCELSLKLKQQSPQYNVPTLHLIMACTNVCESVELWLPQLFPMSQCTCNLLPHTDINWLLTAHKVVLEPWVSPAFSITYFCNQCNRFDPIPAKTWTKGHWPYTCKNLNQRSLTPRWHLTPSLLRSHVWLYPRIIVSKSHKNTSKYVDTVTFF